MHFTPQELWAATGWPVRVVILTLIVMAFWCAYVFFERTFKLMRARGQTRDLAGTITSKLAAGDASAALDEAQKTAYGDSYFAVLMAAGLKEFAARPDKLGIEAAERALERVQISEAERLKKGMSILATTGSTAPFVGLVGTVFGIINAFSLLGDSESGSGLEVVAPAIAEALVTTALGIAVAIFGVWLFNYFTHRIDQITNDMTMSMQELLDWCEKQLWPAQEKKSA